MRASICARNGETGFTAGFSTASETEWTTPFFVLRFPCMVDAPFGGIAKRARYTLVPPEEHLYLPASQGEAAAGASRLSSTRSWATAAKSS